MRLARLATCGAVFAALGGAGALAQDRGPVERQRLADLAYALGESHALRQACHGKADQFWRSRMERLLEVEAPEQALVVRLSKSFNAGFAAASAAFPSCSPQAASEAGQVASRGKRLAGLLIR